MCVTRMQQNTRVMYLASRSEFYDPDVQRLPNREYQAGDSSVPMLFPTNQPLNCIIIVPQEDTDNMGMLKFPEDFVPGQPGHNGITTYESKYMLFSRQVILQLQNQANGVVLVVQCSVMHITPGSAKHAELTAEYDLYLATHRLAAASLVRNVR